MTPLNGYGKAKAYTETERLPIGGYILKILDCTEKTYSWGKVLIFSFDIAEGEQKDFYKHNYNSQQTGDKKWKGTYRLYEPKDDGTEKDGWTMRRFKTVMTDIEKSNEGYHWDWNERGLKGKMIGGIFNNKEYEVNGKTGFFTNCYGFTSTEAIRTGKFKIPADTLLKKTESHATATDDLDAFMNIPDDDFPEEVPFN